MHSFFQMRINTTLCKEKQNKCNACKMHALLQKKCAWCEWALKVLWRTRRWERLLFFLFFYKLKPPLMLGSLRVTELEQSKLPVKSGPSCCMLASPPCEAVSYMQFPSLYAILRLPTCTNDISTGIKTLFSGSVFYLASLIFSCKICSICKYFYCIYCFCIYHVFIWLFELQ